MNPLGQSQNIAARAGRWSARHWKTATLGWLALIALVFVLGSMVGTKELSDAGGMNGDSARAQRIIDNAGFPDNPAEVVLVQSTTLGVRDAAFKRAVGDVVLALSLVKGVEHVQSPYARGNQDQISKSGRSALVPFELQGNTGEAYDGVARSLAAVAAVQAAHPELRIEETGGPSIDRALDDTVEKDFRRAEFSSVPLTLGILLVAVGALLAAFLPVLLALTAFVGATGALAFASQLLPVDDAAGSVMLLIGLAVGVDYSLFYLKREREERALGKGREAALEAAAATSGRSVLISGLTVIVAMAGMFFAGNATFVGVGLGTIIVVATAMLGSLTVLPAVLSRLGDKVEAGRIPGFARARRGRESRVWGALLDRVLHRPLVAAALAGGLLIALALPSIRLHTADPGSGDLPQGLAAVQTLNRIDAAFPGAPDSAAVVVKAPDVTSPSIKAVVQRLEEQVLASGAGHEPIDVDVNPTKTVAVVSVPLAGRGVGDSTSAHALAELRRITSETLDSPGIEALVGGGIAGSYDFNAVIKSHTPLVFAFVLGLAFLLLLVTFRSLVIGVTAIVLNLLSVAAAYGLLVVVFQHGVGASFLGFEATGAIVSWLPLFLFVVLFGLSMDYHVFILSRIREAHVRGLATDEAIAHGIKSTAGVVTAAATVMVFVFAIFATLSQLSLKQLGVGLAAAVLIDATLIRGVLLPATMKLLGEWNWYLPRRLNWLPRLAHEPIKTSNHLQPTLDAAP
ncbi:MAG TPA: MMPL family transporter [Gaiellaceae bacterium]|jgi:RND superfamily putative drug exporter|nr:MMPL family transporter [Gaiellaceae bacterium]